MSSNTLVDIAQCDLKLGSYYTAGARALTDPALHPQVQDYRRLTSSRMYPLDQRDISRRVPDTDVYVSRKVDGEFNGLIYRNGSVCLVNPGGTVRIGLPCLDAAASLLEKAGVKEAVFAGELYVTPTAGRRARVHDIVAVARSPKSTDELDRVAFAVFDIISLDGQPPEKYATTWPQIEQLFPADGLAHRVETEIVSDPAGVKKLFDQWVEDQGAEGVVIRGDDAGWMKLKPRHTIDAVVIGFTESTGDREGLMHDLLLAVMRPDGAMQVVSRVGGGFSEELRRSMLGDLKDMVVDSEFVDVNSDHVAYRMVEPKWVVEISCLDLVSHNVRGNTVNRMALRWDAAASCYYPLRKLPLVSVISPQFVRRREDKKAQLPDIRIQQITALVDVPQTDRDAQNMQLPKSEILQRQVYTKQVKDQTMVRKFVILKTNKETEGEEFPPYVLHFTDFSPNRKDPLKRDVRISSSLEQIRSLWDGMIQDNIKRGWNEYAADGTATPQSAAAPKKKAVSKAAAGTAPAKKAAASKTATKKTAAKKGSAKKATKKAATKKTAAVKKTAASKTPTRKKAPSTTPARKKAAAKKKAVSEAATGAATSAEKPAARKKAASKKPVTKKTAAKKAAKSATTRKKAKKKGAS